ncbi:MAG: multidrug effflux MFS transporter [Caenispirillum sp.]|nr:multidrug effflux MFS transporter [Caenispirillum sp.]
MARSTSDTAARAEDMAFGEFVAIVALMMALTALSIDIMLVALPDIAASYALSDPNDRQLVITAYLLGFAAGQPVCGPLSDRFGRKPVLAAGILVFGVGSLGALAAPDFGWLLWARALMGLGAAAPRIMAISIVRDRFAGRGMARVMSFVMMIFIIIPIIAPSLGALILLGGDWHWIFAALFAVGLLLLVWTGVRLPETLPPAKRRPLSLGSIGEAARTVVTTRQTVGYTLAMGFMFGSLMTYIGSAQQVFMDAYDVSAEMFPLLFALVASVMALASLTNARLVERIGMRRVSHAALLGFVAAGAVLAAFGFPALPPLAVLVAFLMVTFFCFGLIAPNFNALAMEPLGHIAGMGSSLTGFYGTAGGAVFGWLAGQAYDGSVQPLTVGFAAFGVLALVCVLVTERGRLFGGHH